MPNTNALINTNTGLPAHLYFYSSISSFSAAVRADYHLAANLLPWSVASIKMLLLSRVPGRETNSQGITHPLRPLPCLGK